MRLSTQAVPAGPRPRVAPSIPAWIRRLMGDASGGGTAERRRAGRSPMASEVTLMPLDTGGDATAPGSIRVFLRDLSGAGCGVWSRTRLEPGVSVMVVFPVRAGQPGAHHIARVRHCRGAEATGFAVGLRFESESKPV